VSSLHLMRSSSTGWAWRKATWKIHEHIWSSNWFTTYRFIYNIKPIDNRPYEGSELSYVDRELVQIRLKFDNRTRLNREGEGKAG